MSTTPITLDFSKAQPISADQNAGVSPPVSSGSPSAGVQLDFSKAQPVAQDQAIASAQSTVAKPTPKTDQYGVVDPSTGIDPVTRMRDYVHDAEGALAPDTPPKPNKDFHVALDHQTGKLNYTYPSGQKAFDPEHPDISTDDAGNIYFQGNKADMKIGIAFPTPGVGLPTAGTIAAGTRTAAQTFREFLQSDAAKEGAKFLGKHALKGAAEGLGITGIAGGLYKLGKILGYF